MPDRLRATDAAFLAAESARAPRQVAVVMILQPGERGFEHAGLLRLIDDRIGLVPRYRQRVRFLLGGVFGGVLGGVATPYWVDDEAFDLGFPKVALGGRVRVGNGSSVSTAEAHHLPRPVSAMSTESLRVL